MTEKEALKQLTVKAKKMLIQHYEHDGEQYIDALEREIMAMKGYSVSDIMQFDDDDIYDLMYNIVVNHDTRD